MGHICNPSIPLVSREVERRDSSHSSLASTATESREGLPQNKEEKNSSPHSALPWPQRTHTLSGQTNKIKQRCIHSHWSFEAYSYKSFPKYKLMKHTFKIKWYRTGENKEMQQNTAVSTWDQLETKLASKEKKTLLLKNETR